MACARSSCKCRGDCPERFQPGRSLTGRANWQWSPDSMAVFFGIESLVVVPPDTRAPEGAKVPLLAQAGRS